jgi:hypothetical protein
MSANDRDEGGARQAFAQPLFAKRRRTGSPTGSGSLYVKQ